MVPVKRLSGGAGTHGHTDHTDEPHNHPSQVPSRYTSLQSPRVTSSLRPSFRPLPTGKIVLKIEHQYITRLDHTRSQVKSSQVNSHLHCLPRRCREHLRYEVEVLEVGVGSGVGSGLGRHQEIENRFRENTPPLRPRPRPRRSTRPRDPVPEATRPPDPPPEPKVESRRRTLESQTLKVRSGNFVASPG